MENKNFLPNQFQTKDFWEKHFNINNKNFEWYAEFEDLESSLTKELKTENKILIIGCGSSDLSNKLYDKGFHEITNIDISEKIIEKEKKLNIEKRPKMVYLQMDASKLEFENEYFDAIIDKGTLDALFVNDDPTTIDNINKMWNSILRCIKSKGKYIFISLLQRHIISHFIEFFSKGTNNQFFLNCIFTTRSADIFPIKASKYLPFFITVEKQIFDIKNEPLCNYKNKFKDNIYYYEDSLQVAVSDNFLNIVRQKQINYFIINDASSGFLIGRTLQLTIVGNNNATPKYIIQIIDHEKKEIISKKTCSVFLSPLGRENQFLFASEEGNRQLLNDSGDSRMYIIRMCQGYKFTSYDEVMKEISPIINKLTPKECKNKDKIKILKMNDEIGKREIVYHQDNICISDYLDIDNTVIRNLVFDYTPYLAQSTVCLKLASQDSKTQLVSELFEGKSCEINHDALCCEYQRAVIVGLSLLDLDKFKQNIFEMVLLGTGAGVLSSFLSRNFLNMRIKSVDIDSRIVDIGKKFFGFEVNDRLESIISDAEAYLKNIKENSLEILLFDMDDPDPGKVIAPPLRFLNFDILKFYSSLLKEDGLLIINFLCSNPEEKENIIFRFKTIWNYVFRIKLLTEKNEIFIMTNSKKDPSFFQIKKVKNRFTEMLKIIEKSWHLQTDMIEILSSTELLHSKIPALPKKKKNNNKKKKKN